MFKNAIYATLSAPFRTTLRFVGDTRMSRELWRACSQDAPEGHTKGTPLFGRNGYVPLAELQDRIIVS